MDDTTRELYKMLAEEAGEVVQACMKILRHGEDSCHPDTPEVSNLQHLRRELADFSVVSGMLQATGAVSETTDEEIDDTLARKLKYMHHPPVFSD